jgi:hypothetical protein
LIGAEYSPNARGTHEEQSYIEKLAAMIAAFDSADDFVTDWLNFGASEDAEFV